MAPPNLALGALVILATVLSVAIPIKIWNTARIEHRLQEQETLLMSARVEALSNQINPHFLFNNAHVHLLADPLTAGDGAHAGHQAVGSAPPAAPKSGAVRHARRRARRHRRVSRHRDRPLRSEARRREGDRPGHLGPRHAQHAAPAAGRERHQARHREPREWGTRDDPEPTRDRPHGDRGRRRRERDGGARSRPQPLVGHRAAERRRAPARHLRRELSPEDGEHAGRGDLRPDRDPRAARAQRVSA